MTDGLPTDADPEDIMSTIYSRNRLLNNTVTILTYLIGGKFQGCCSVSALLLPLLVLPLMLSKTSIKHIFEM